MLEHMDCAKLKDLRIATISPPSNAHQNPGRSTRMVAGSGFNFTHTERPQTKDTAQINSARYNHMQHQCCLESGDIPSGPRLDLQSLKLPPRHQWITIPEIGSSALMAEGLTVREALLHAQHLGISKIWIKTDS